MTSKSSRGSRPSRASAKAPQAKRGSSKRRTAPARKSVGTLAQPTTSPVEQSRHGNTAIVLRTGRSDFHIAEVKATDRTSNFNLTLERAAMQWTYIVRNRLRWTDLAKQQAEKAENFMKQFGVQDAALQELT